MPHEDGGAYAPVVATISLGGSLCLDVMAKSTAIESTPNGDTHLPSNPPTSKFTLPTRILQEPRSLLITTGDAYRDLMHGIASIEVDEDLNVETVANWGLLDDVGKIERAGGKSVRGTRVSLTYRDVVRVSSAASRVLGGTGRR